MDREARIQKMQEAVYGLDDREIPMLLRDAHVFSQEQLHAIERIADLEGKVMSEVQLDNRLQETVDETRKALAEQLVARKKELGLTNRKIAKRMGKKSPLSYSGVVSNWLKLEKNPELPSLLSLVGALDMALQISFADTSVKIDGENLVSNTLDVLREAAKATGLTQFEIGVAMGNVTASRVADILSHSGSDPKLDTFLRFATVVEAEVSLHRQLEHPKTSM